MHILWIVKVFLRIKIGLFTILGIILPFLCPLPFLFPHHIFPFLNFFACYLKQFNSFSNWSNFRSFVVIKLHTCKNATIGSLTFLAICQLYRTVIRHTVGVYLSLIHVSYQINHCCMYFIIPSNSIHCTVLRIIHCLFIIFIVVVFCSIDEKIIKVYSKLQNVVWSLQSSTLYSVVVFYFILCLLWIRFK